MKQRLYIFLLTLLTCVNAAWGQTHTETYDGVTYNVVYLNVNAGNDSRDGASVANAVRTWGGAYKRLPNYTGTSDAERDEAWDHNIIVVLNTNNNATLLIDETIAKGNGTKGIPATITGVWPWTTDNTTAANVKAKGRITLNASGHNNTTASGTTRIGADTKFKYLGIRGTSCFLSMYLHDATFDVGCIMYDMNNLTSENGALKIGSTTRKAPDMQVFMFANVYVFSTSSTDGGWPAQSKPVTLTIKSGKFGRILSNRITGTSAAQVKERYVIGNPSHPFMCVVNIDIDPETSTGAWNTRDDVDDIAYLCAGMTQGVEYCDTQFNIKRGKIATLVGAMQGNSIVATETVGISNSSFFGRTVVNINPDKDADVTIYRYYATCFGRYTNNSATLGTSNAAFYGQSYLNMHGGTIESGVYATAGGITGLKSPDGTHHTIDKFVPYLDNTDTYKNYPYMGIKYQPFDESGTKVMPTFTTTLNGSSETIDLTTTFTQMNIYGGTINGGIYGGGYGFSPEMPAARAIAGAGSFWGETNVNIYGGTINGGVYGGGAGDPTYYNDAEAAKKAGFLTVASVYGNTNVNIYGGTFDDTGIYGGGAGLKSAGNVGDPKEFLDIAKVYGNTNVTIDPRMPDDFETKNPSWTFTGNIYGGGALGAVEGATNVIIKGGIITGNVFGAGMGEDGHPNKAKVTGDTNVTVGE